MMRNEIEVLIFSPPLAVHCHPERPAARSTSSLHQIHHEFAPPWSICSASDGTEYVAGYFFGGFVLWPLFFGGHQSWDFWCIEIDFFSSKLRLFYAYPWYSVYSNHGYQMHKSQEQFFMHINQQANWCIFTTIVFPWCFYLIFGCSLVWIGGLQKWRATNAGKHAFCAIDFFISMLSWANRVSKNSFRRLLYIVGAHFIYCWITILYIVGAHLYLMLEHTFLYIVLTFYTLLEHIYTLLCGRWDLGGREAARRR